MLRTLPLSSLRHGHDAAAPDGVCNVRIAGREEGLDELAASIDGLGLLQPLVVVVADGLGYVADGNRRLAALLRLAAAGKLQADTDVDVVERDAATARAAGLAANIMQSSMHEADQFAAFADLAAGGMKPKEIAAKFGASLPHVKKLLALGSVAPCILDAWRTGKHGVNLEDVKAFTIAPSVDEQARVYAKLSARGGTIYSHAIREELGADHGTDRLLRIVGVDAYAKAGGKVAKDLFGDTHVVSDKPLLKRLADEGLIVKRDELRGQGWAWVDIEGDLPNNAWWLFPGFKRPGREMTDAEAARLGEIQDMMEREDDGSVSGDAIEAATKEAAAIEAEIDGTPTESDRPQCGCIVRHAYDGRVEVREYVQRPGEAKVAKVTAGGEAQPPEAKGISSALVDRLATQLTRAAQDSLETSPQAAIAATLAAVGCKDRWQAPVRIRLEGLGGAEAVSPENGSTFEQLFSRYMEMPVAEMMAAVGRVLAPSIDLRCRMPGSNGVTGAPSEVPATQAFLGSLDASIVAQRIGDRWDAGDFFGSAPRVVTESAIAEACGPEAAVRARKLKKGELVEVALATVVPTGWIPVEMRWAGYAGPGSETPILVAAE